MRISDFAVSLGLMAIAGAAIVIGNSFPPAYDPSAPDPAFYPRVVALVLLAFIIGDLILARLGRASDALVGDAVASRLALAGVAGMAVYLLFIRWLGFFVATPILIAGGSWLLGARSLPAVIAIALGTTLFFYFVFDVGFALPLPLGILG